MNIPHTSFVLAHSCKIPSKKVSTVFSNLMSREFLKVIRHIEAEV
jgi:5,10-methenyltetrahydromethanopterin hydrogenase